MKKYHGPKEQLDDARLPETTADVLKILAESPYDFVRTAIAEHPNTEPSTLAELVPRNLESSPGQYLAAAIARNKNTPDYALCRLGESVAAYLDNQRGHRNYFEIGIALICNPNTPLETIEVLLAPEHTATEFRKVAARETRRRDVLRLLQVDRSEIVRKQVVKTEQTLLQHSSEPSQQLLSDN